MVLKSCKAGSCREPWSTLHPDGKIKTLNHALHGSFDAFYEKQPKVSFSSCQLGYLRSEEGPQDAVGEQETLGYREDWGLWT
jgi:N-acetylglucosamine-6-sulfatase